jgi:sensor domain CHASE-containing protein
VAAASPHYPKERKIDMKLHLKTLLLIGASSLALMAILVVSSQHVILGSFQELESETMQVHVKRGMNEIRNQLHQLDSVAGDWAPWDETYAFIQNRNTGYIKDNLQVETLQNLGVDYILFFDASGKLVFSKSIDRELKKEALTPSEMVNTISPWSFST